eukprot:scaffold80539_cov78-Phaeocystis_antarctica.AAC.1
MRTSPRQPAWRPRLGRCWPACASRCRRKRPWRPSMRPRDPCVRVTLTAAPSADYRGGRAPRWRARAWARLCCAVAWAAGSLNKLSVRVPTAGPDADGRARVPTELLSALTDRQRNEQPGKQVAERKSAERKSAPRTAYGGRHRGSRAHAAGCARRTCRGARPRARFVRLRRVCPALPRAALSALEALRRPLARACAVARGRQGHPPPRAFPRLPMRVLFFLQQSSQGNIQTFEFSSKGFGSLPPGG